MRSFVLLALPILFFSSNLFAQEILSIPWTTAPTVDGSFAPGEWDDAATVEISIGGSVSVDVRSVHDGENLYIAFTGPFGGPFLFPEVFVDPDNSKSAEWDALDWWFHVSGTDCESQGAPDDYTICELELDDWQGVPNFTPERSPDTIEIVLPFSKLGVEATLPQTIGLTYGLTNTFSSWQYWPSAATSASPAMWGTAILQPKEVSSVHDGGEILQYPVLMNLR